MQLVSDSRIDDQALDWVYRIAAGEDPAKADAWRAQNPAHDSAFRDAWAAWQVLDQTPTAQGDGWRDELAAIKAERWYRRPLARFAVPTAIAATIAAAVMILPGRMEQPGAAPVAIATKLAEDKIVKLSDGSRLTMGAQTHLAVNVAAPNRREVTLNDGQAFFEVAHDPSRPFYVIAGDAEIRVVGTKFDVRRIGNDVQVSVLEGRVEVRRRGQFATADSTRVLTAGEQSNFRPELAASFAPEKPASVTPGEWRTGRRFYVDAPLSDIVADANRYSTTPIRLADPQVGALRMTTSFRTGDVDGLVANMEATLQIQGRKAPDGALDLRQR
jgi:transmembrane sensor